MDGEELGPNPEGKDLGEMGLKPEDLSVTGPNQSPEKGEGSPTEASTGFLTEWADRLHIDEWVGRLEKAGMVAGPLGTGLIAYGGNPEAALGMGVLSAFNAARHLLEERRS